MSIFEEAKVLTWGGASLISALEHLLAHGDWKEKDRKEAEALVKIGRARNEF